MILPRLFSNKKVITRQKSGDCFSSENTYIFFKVFFIRQVCLKVSDYRSGNLQLCSRCQKMVFSESIFLNQQTKTNLTLKLEDNKTFSISFKNFQVTLRQKIFCHSSYALLYIGRPKSVSCGFKRFKP